MAGDSDLGDDVAGDSDLGDVVAGDADLDDGGADDQEPDDATDSDDADQAGDTADVDPLEVVCQPCEDDDECGEGGRCAELEDGFFCGLDCTDSADVCGERYACVEIDEGGDADPLWICLPATDRCMSCPPGFVDEGDDGTSCRQINECEEELDDCDPLVSCGDLDPTLDPGGRFFACGPCPDGYDDTNGDGTLCSDIDECASDNGGCEHICDNDDGTFACDCNPGYTLNVDGSSCDALAPAILSARTVDADTVSITFTKAVSDSTVAASDFNFSGFATAEANAVGSESATGGVADDAVVEIRLAAALGTGESGTVALTAAGAIEDLSGNGSTDTTPVAVADGVGPVIVSAMTVDLTTVEITLSEPIDDSSVAATDLVFSGFTMGGANAPGAGFATGAASDDQIVEITLAAGIGPDDVGSVAFAQADVVDDLLGNGNLNLVPIAVTDGIGPLPAIASARTIGVSTVEVTFTDNMDDGSVQGADFVFSGFGTSGANAAGVGFSTGSGSDDPVVAITLAAAIGAGESGNVALAAVGAVESADGRSSFHTSPVAVSDGIPPRIAGARTVDDTTVEVTFSEPVNDSSVAAESFLFTDFATSAVNTFGATFSSGAPDDAVVRVSLVTAIGTGETGNVRLVGDDLVRDLAANGNTDTTPVAVADGVGPVIVSAMTVDLTTVEITLSEPIDDSSVAATDLVFSGFGTGAANAPGAGFATGSASDDHMVEITLAAGIGPDETGSVVFAATDVVDDALGNGNPFPEPVLVTDGVGVEYCGSGFCDAGESWNLCPGDCLGVCGDAVCDVDEQAIGPNDALFCADDCRVTIIFELDATTFLPEAGEGAWIVGNEPEFGNWTPNTIPLADDGVAPDLAGGDQLFTAAFAFDPGAALEYKYTIGPPGADWAGTEEYEGGNNRGYVVPSNGTRRIRIRDFVSEQPSENGGMGASSTLTIEDSACVFDGFCDPSHETEASCPSECP